MRTFRISMIIALLVCLAPVASTLLAMAVAKLYGCTLHEGNVNPCIIAGGDRGSLLYNLAMWGWLMLATVPIGAGLILVWIVTEIIRRVRGRAPSNT
jgi:hypothetical protein